MAIIERLTDDDLYKFTMQQVVLHKFPSAIVEYKFQDRGNVGLGFLAGRVREEINALANIQATPEELTYLRSLKFLKRDYVDFLRIFRFFTQEHISVSSLDDRLEIRIRGPWLHTILYEVKVLAIVNQCYYEHLIESKGLSIDSLEDEGERRLREKIKLIKEQPSFNDFVSPFLFSNFGTRRRFSRDWAYQVDAILAHEFRNWNNNPAVGFTGTSNVYNAMVQGIKPIGTMAHEYLQAMQAMTRIVTSQQLALQSWAEEYRGDLGIALTDCLGLEIFLKDFDLYFAKLFDGVRHDSGDPDWWTEKIINHYKTLGIDPRTKTAVFSDGLNVPLAIELWKTWGNQIKTAFGIGTNLTNDLGLDALKIVLKMVVCNNQPVAKISDSDGKGMCEDSGYIEYLKNRIQMRISE